MKTKSDRQAVDSGTFIRRDHELIQIGISIGWRHDRHAESKQEMKETF